MALTLEDLMMAPSNPDDLNKHLLDRGLIQPPPTPAEPEKVAPMSAVTPPSNVAPMVKPTAEAPFHGGFSKSADFATSLANSPVMPKSSVATMTPPADLGGAAFTL